MTYHNHTNLLCQPTLQNNQINAIKEKNMSFVFIFPSLSATNKFFTWPERGAYSSDETSCKAADYFSSCFRRARFFSPNGSDIYIYIYCIYSFRVSQSLISNFQPFFSDSQRYNFSKKSPLIRRSNISRIRDLISSREEVYNGVVQDQRLGR